jgi:hypothetical protein
MVPDRFNRPVAGGLPMFDSMVLVFMFGFKPILLRPVFARIDLKGAPGIYPFSGIFGSFLPKVVLGFGL